MTWIIGASTAFGYGLVLSDTCVTYTLNGKKKTIDGALQKAFPLGPFIVGGFAGSVFIGFQMLDRLQEFLQLPKNVRNSIWKIDWVAKNWQPIAQEIFNKCSIKERKAGSHLLLVGAHPTKDVGIPGFAKIHIVIMKSPNFQPVIMQEKFLAIESIGIGADVYKSELKKILKDDYSIAEAEVGHPGGMGTVLKIDITNKLRENPAVGVSQYLHTFFVKRGKISSGNNNFTEWRQGGEKVEFKMPLVAQNYTDLLKILKIKKGEAVLTA